MDAECIDLEVLRRKEQELIREIDVAFSLRLDPIVRQHIDSLYIDLEVVQKQIEILLT